jgi:hypothetical protein
VVNVAGGLTQAGVNIDVSSPASTPTPNAESLGVTQVGEGGSAFNTGATIRRGTTRRVIMFGAGLEGSMKVSIRGPNDITVRNVTSIRSQAGTPGVAFEAVVSSGAALGARTVVLQAGDNDVTVFAGGLEVVP